MDRFSNQVVLVTGAASGLGQATALRFGSEAANVAALDIDKEGAEQTAESIRAKGGQAAAYHCDISDPRWVEEVVARIATDLRSINVVCNVAGIGQQSHSTDISYEDFAHIIAVNLTGTFLVCKAALPHLLASHGNIVSVASNAALTALPYGVAYGASKAGVAMMTKSLALEYLPDGVRVNAVAPGGMDTPMILTWSTPQDMRPETMDRFASPLGMIPPDQVAAMIVFLASDEARYVTGSIVSVDGGTTV